MMSCLLNLTKAGGKHIKYAVNKKIMVIEK
jgi:hypothetical protein